MGPIVDPVSNKFKIIFVMYNLVLWTSGLILLWFGIWLEVEFSRYIQLDWQVVSYVMLITGSLIVLFNSLACFCALKGESSSLLNAYGVVLGVLFVIELLISVSMLWLKQLLMRKFNGNNGLTALQATNSTTTTGGQMDMDLIQSSLKCCGLKGAEDWFNVLHSAVPSSCCLSDIPNCDTRQAGNVWTRGCTTEMESFIDNNIGVISILVLFFAAVGLFGVFCSFSWARKYSSSYEVIGD